MFTRWDLCLRSFVRSLVLLSVLALCAVLIAPAARPEPARPVGTADSVDAENGDSTKAAPREGEKTWEKIYEVGKAWYDAYEAFEEKRNDVSLKAPFRLEVTPEVMKVTENAVNRLPNVEVKAGVAWWPYKGQTTTVHWQFEIGGGTGGKGSFSNTGRPTRDEWEDWYSERPFPYSGGGFDNDHLKYEFDVVANGEAFNEGVNTVKVKLWGKTRVVKNMWAPWNWFGDPIEDKDFEQVVSQSRDVTVEVPYAIRKDPNLDMVEQNHQANLTVRLWDRNLARQAIGGNVQNYYEPKVRVQCEDGTVPPDAGTSDSEKMVCSDTRVHDGGHPPERVHVFPDFDPIHILVKHQVWDLPENANKVYQRTIDLRKTELWCLQPPLVPTTTPTEPPAGDPVPTPGGCTPHRNARTPSPSIDDPDTGFQSLVETPVLWEIFSLRYGRPRICGYINSQHPDHVIYSGVESGDLVLYRYTLRDLFGRTFQCEEALEVPPADDLNAPEDVMAAPPILHLIDREWLPDPIVPIEIVALELTGMAFGEMRPAPSVMVRDDLNGQVAWTDPNGRCEFELMNGQHFRLGVQDPYGRYLPLQLPMSPPVLQALAVRDAANEAGLNDDRVYLWMTPTFQQGCLVPGAGKLYYQPEGYTANIGACSRLDPARVQMAEWQFQSGEPIAPALVDTWGATDGLGLGYVPARFLFDGEHAAPEVYQRLALEQVVRLRVSTFDREECELELPLTVEDLTAGVTPAAGLGFALRAPVPNPAMTRANVSFELPAAARVRLGVYDLQGRLVRLLVDEERSAGGHTAVWDTQDAHGKLAVSGVYFFRLEAGARVESRRMTLVR